MNKFFKKFIVALLIASLSVFPLAGLNGGVQAQVSFPPPQGLLKDLGYIPNTNTSTTVPTPLSPSGTITDTTPTFKWTRISGATKYGYSLYKGSALKYSKTVAASACGSSTITCSNTPTTVLSTGAYKWKVRAYVAGTWRAYSAFKSFTLQLPTGFINGGFESGPKVGWTVYSSHGQTLIGTGDFFNSSEITPRVNPRHGNYMARLGGFDYEISAIGENVRLPNVTPLYVTFYYQIRASSGTDCGDPYYSGLVLVEINSQKVINSDYLCEYNNTSGWVKLSINVSAVAGKTVPIIFRVEAPNYEWTYLYLDDISVGQTP